MNGLTDRYRYTLSDKLDSTSTITHDTKLTTDIPVYNVAKTFEEEVNRKTTLGVIEPSVSPYCSPTI